MLNSRKYDIQEGHHLEAAKIIGPVFGDIPLILVGGMRRVDHMAEILEKGNAYFISICHPFIGEPFLVKRNEEGKTGPASCVSCNKCHRLLTCNLVSIEPLVDLGLEDGKDPDRALLGEFE